MSKTFLFFDFDGVLCDSLPECFVSSLLAWNRWNGRKPDTAGEILGLTERKHPGREMFGTLRPFVRNGGDYLFIHLAMESGTAVAEQKDFDALMQGNPDLSLAAGELFQNCRSEILSEDRGRWLELNPLFDGIPRLLETESRNTSAFILSTKPIRFILEILRHNGIDWTEERCICSGGRPKVDIIDEVMAVHGTETDTAWFVDDQIDHLILPHRLKTAPLLASWGYVKKEWLEDPRIQPVSIEDLLSGVELCEK
jgi:phosphoglycolate phosphatase-like HAD superfamily hydrolase